MKIKFIAYWNSDREIYNIINDIWNIDGKYNDILTCDSNYTHLVVLNKTIINFSKKNTYGIIIEPFWSPNFDKNLPDKCDKVISYQPDKYPNNNNVVFSPLIGTHRLYKCRYHGEIIYEKDTTKNILNTDFVKSKKLSIIVNYHTNYKTQKEKSPESLYLERFNLVNKLLESDLEFDMFGQDWKINDPRYKGFIQNKIDAIKDYKYTISLENSNISGEITEKYIDAIMCDTIPIYNGNTDISKYYPNSYEYLEYNGDEIERIKEIINSNKTLDDYELDNAKNKYLNEYNPIKIIVDLIKNEK